MSKETTYAGMLGDVQRLATALTANATDLPHLEGSRVKLDTMLTQAQEVTKQQAAFTASKQEATQQLRTLVKDSLRLANVLRVAVKEHYGIRSEKLAEFGLQPFRGLIRKVKPEAPDKPSI